MSRIYLCLLCNVIIFYCDELSNRIGHKLLEIRGKQKTHELIQTGGKRRKIRRKQNITIVVIVQHMQIFRSHGYYGSSKIRKYLDVTEFVVVGPNL
jgi:hypothetical protein